MNIDLEVDNMKHFIIAKFKDRDDTEKLNGFINVSTTKSSGDHGADILADKYDVRYAIQCKNYIGNVGNSAIQEVFSAKSFYNCDIAVVMTNSSFTQQAIEEAGRLGVKLWDGQKIKELQEKAI